MLVEALKSLGLTGYEAQVYVSLVQRGEQTGYEIAQSAGMARANVYNAISSLVDKGAAHQVSSEPARYVAVPPSELGANVLRNVEKAVRLVEENLRPHSPSADAVISLEGEETIKNKILNLITSAHSTIYLNASATDIEDMAEYLEKAADRGVKVVIISLGRCPVHGFLVYENRTPASWIVGEGRPVRIIIDSVLMLTGELGRGKMSRGVYTQNLTLVTMAKHSYVQEIILAEVRREFEQELTERFGPDFASVREKVAGRKQ